MDHTLDDCRAAVAEWEEAQPIYLGCGCLEGTHDNTIDAMRAAHPDAIYWNSSVANDHWQFH